MLPRKTIILKATFTATIVVLSISLFSACSSQGQPTTAPVMGNAQQAEVLKAQDEHLRKVEVTVVARVEKMLPDDNEGLPHERFLIHLANGTTVLIAHDTRMAPRVPLREGDIVTIHGEYIWTDKGGVIHWTHHSDNGRHEGGWIELTGKRYD